MRALMAVTICIVATACSAAPILPRGPVEGTPPDLSTAMEWEAASRGRAIAQVGCASCHAIDSTGTSPMAGATPFREIVKRRSLDNIESGMATGLVTSRPAMPPYTFRAAEIDDLREYLETLKAARPPR